MGAIGDDDDRRDVLVGGGGSAPMRMSELSTSSTGGHGGF